MTEIRKDEVRMQFWAVGTSLVAQTVKRLPKMQETQVQSLGWEDLLKKGTATHPVALPRAFHGQRSLVATVHGVAKRRLGA